MEDVLVSIVMPAYNAEKYIDKCINSIIEQKYKNWELIIIDDYSDDNTYDKITKYGNYPNIKVFRNDKNRGISYTTNRAINLSKGKYIALMDDDDIALPDRIKLQVDYLENNKDIHVLGGRSIEIDEQGNILTYCNEPKKNPLYIKAELLFGMVNFTNSTLMFRRGFLLENNIQLQENCYGIQDLVFYMDCSKVGNITSIDIPLIMHRIYKTSTTQKMLKEENENRQNAFKKAQRNSLEKSGYILSENEYEIFYKAFAEQKGKCDSIDELNALYNILKKLINQCNEMHGNYINELKIICVNKIAIQMKKLDIFGNEISGLLIR